MYESWISFLFRAAHKAYRRDLQSIFFNRMVFLREPARRIVIIWFSTLIFESFNAQDTCSMKHSLSIE
jgi:hypothetical protein